MYQTILMPTDGSACSNHAISEGLELAKALGAQVTFLFALEDPLSAAYAVPDAVPYRPQIYEDMKKEATRILEEAEALASTQGVSAKTIMAERTNPIKAIVTAEKDHDLIIMGTHGRRGFNRWMFGSVAEGVLRRAGKPCLLIRSDKEETD